ncbi:DUF2339 domain-containing protein [Flavobacterium sp. H122]|uniref:DUF2339 domain-containing protein n=1 Tax=Flavobacterium sp. H122 TaxID=2529860 RepID=UPI0010AA1EF4|nr:DUF2339 domain-containing protein [Flavobacterium sp. H122]
MEIILLLIILVVLIILMSNLNAKLSSVVNSMDEMKRKIVSLQAYMEKKSEDFPPLVQDKETVAPPVVKEEQKFASFEDIVDDEDEEIQIKETILDTVSEHKESEKFQLSGIEDEEINAEPAMVSDQQEPAYKEPQKTWFEKFRENNPDLEKFVGENLINKIGILILVLGISFFVKYAIDKNWINETARVGIGILAGSLVMGVAHKLKKEYKAFSSVMVAGAISIFYFTIAIAFHDYQLFSQPVAFSIMVVITAFSTFVSLAYDRQELSVLSLIGGFAVPFMVSTGQGNYIVLFVYIAVLNIGILGIAYFKKWNLLTLLSFLFTSILFVSWYTVELDKNTLPHKGALIFATVFYFLFSIIAVLNNIRNKGLFTKMEYFIIVANTFVYFGIGLGIIHNWGIEAKGLFTLSLAVYNLIYAGFLFKKFGLDKNAVYLLIGFVFTFVTITIPVQFEGNQITLFWACEAVLLYWLSQKSKIELFKTGAVLVQLLTIISLIMDWTVVYSDSGLTVVFNQGFLTGLVVSGSLVVTYFLLKKEEEKIKIATISLDTVLFREIVSFTALAVGYLVGMFEITYQADQYIANESSALSLPVTYHYVFSGALLFFGLKLFHDKFFKPLTVLTILNVLLYVGVFCVIPSEEIFSNLLYRYNYSIALILHFIILGCIAYFVVFLVKQIMEKPAFGFMKSKWVLWGLVFCGVYILSNEIIIHSYYFTNTKDYLISLQKQERKDSTVNFSFIYDQMEMVRIQVVKIGFPVLWGILSFAMLIFGIRKQWKDIRIIALSLLGLTIVKLFVYDINNVSESGKIIAFILLGVLVLIISFVYQKIKKLVVDEDANTVLDEKIN